MLIHVMAGDQIPSEAEDSIVARDIVWIQSNSIEQLEREVQSMRLESKMISDSDRKKDISLCDRVFLTLQQHNRSMKATEIAQKINIPKASVNRTLYHDLKGKVVKNQDNTWIVVTQIQPTAKSASQPPPFNNEKQDTQKDTQLNFESKSLKKPESLDDNQSFATPTIPLRARIESILRSNSNSKLSAKELRRLVKVPQTKLVNQTLYSMLEDGVVTRSDGQPPLWGIS